jgi:hypothetical protein
MCGVKGHNDQLVSSRLEYPVFDIPLPDAIFLASNLHLQAHLARVVTFDVG